MLKNIAQLEHKIGERVFRFICDVDAPLQEVKEALFQCLKDVGQIEDTVNAQRAQAAAEKQAETKEPEKVEDGNQQ